MQAIPCEWADMKCWDCGYKMGSEMHRQLCGQGDRMSQIEGDDITPYGKGE